jgi:hypothetical protein
MYAQSEFAEAHVNGSTIPLDQLPNQLKNSKEKSFFAEGNRSGHAKMIWNKMVSKRQWRHMAKRT